MIEPRPVETTTCYSCQGPKAAISCGICENRVCKQCAQWLEKGSFAHLVPLPKELTHQNYCGRCFVETVMPAQTAYDDQLTRAKKIFVFLKQKAEETRLMSRTEKAIEVDHCSDEPEALLRLAFLAAGRNFNALIDVVVRSRIVRNFGYQSSLTRASGIPTMVNVPELERRDLERRT